MNKPNQLISNEELIFSNMLEIQAIIGILVAKGITTEDEIMQVVAKLKEEMEGSANGKRELTTKENF